MRVEITWAIIACLAALVAGVAIGKVTLCTGWTYLIFAPPLVAPPLSFLLRRRFSRPLGPQGCAIGTAVAVLCAGVIPYAFVPNVSCFRCRPKQSEAKLNLTILFTAEKMFAGEYGVYTTDLVALNFFPKGNSRYVYGFSVPTSPLGSPTTLPDYDASRMTTADPRVFAGVKRGVRTDLPSEMQTVRTIAGRPIVEKDLAAADPSATAGLIVSTMTTSGSMRFRAVAVGDIDDDRTAEDSRKEVLDVWTIDDQMRLTALSNDCTKERSPQ